MVHFGGIPNDLLPVCSVTAGSLLRNSLEVVRSRQGGPGLELALATLVPVTPTSTAALLRSTPRHVELATAVRESRDMHPAQGACGAADTPGGGAPGAAVLAKAKTEVGGNIEAEAESAVPGASPGASPGPSPEASPEASPLDTGELAELCDSVHGQRTFGGPAKEGSSGQADTAKRLVHIFITSPPGVGKTTMVQRLLAMLQKEEGDEVGKISGFYTEEMRDEQGQRCGFDAVRLGSGPSGSAPRCALARLGQEPPRVGKYSVDVTAFELLALPALPTARSRAALPSNARLYTPVEGTPEVVRLFEDADADGEDAGVRIFVPSLGQELQVESSTLQPVPEDEDQDESAGQAEVSTTEGGAQGKTGLCVCDEVGKMALLSRKFPAALLSALNSGVAVLGTLPQPPRGQRDHEVVERVRRRGDVRVVRLTRHNREALLPEVYKTLRESLSLGPPGSGQARREERERREKAEKAQGEERRGQLEEERAAKRQRREARERERAAEAQRLARKRELLSKSTRERRKARALVRKRAQELSGVVMAVGDEEQSDNSLEFEDDVDAVDDLDDVEDIDVVVDVEDKGQRVQKSVAMGVQPLAPGSKPKPGKRAEPKAIPCASGPGGIVLLDEVL